VSDAANNEIDSVYRSKLLTKFDAYGISGALFNWIEAFYMMGNMLSK